MGMVFDIIHVHCRASTENPKAGFMILCMCVFRDCTTYVNVCTCLVLLIALPIRATSQSENVILFSCCVVEFSLVVSHFFLLLLRLYVFALFSASTQAEYTLTYILIYCVYTIHTLAAHACMCLPPRFVQSQRHIFVSRILRKRVGLLCKY